MPVETDADRLAFLDDDEYGVVARWTSAGGSVDLPAIFDADYQLLTVPLLDGGAEGSGPQILLRSSDVPADAAHEDAITLHPGTAKAATYRVVEIKPDGTGMTTVRLQEG